MEKTLREISRELEKVANDIHEVECALDTLKGISDKGMSKLLFGLSVNLFTARRYIRDQKEKADSALAEEEKRQKEIAEAVHGLNNEPEGDGSDV